MLVRRLSCGVVVGNVEKDGIILSPAEAESLAYLLTKLKEGLPNGGEEEG